jgi:hypothetical protein
MMRMKRTIKVMVPWRKNPATVLASVFVTLKQLYNERFGEYSPFLFPVFYFRAGSHDLNP